MSTEDNKQDKIVLIGTVIESLPDTHFRIQLDDGAILLAYMSGKMKYNRIRIYVGDKVEVELDSYGGKPKLIRRK
jgi:translation initiation factor IF-1